MDILLYKANKKPKSTARPSGGSRVSGEIKHDCSIINPTFREPPERPDEI